MSLLLTAGGALGAEVPARPLPEAVWITAHRDRRPGSPGAHAALQ
jgi:hypothetical protein